MIKITLLVAGITLLLCTANAQNVFPSSGPVGVGTTSPTDQLVSEKAAVGTSYNFVSRITAKTTASNESVRLGFEENAVNGGHSRVYFNVSTDRGIYSNSGFVNQLNGTNQWFFGMSNEGQYGGTPGTSSGRYMGYYDYLASTWRYGFNASGELYLGASNSTYGVKLSPTGISAFMGGNVGIGTTTPGCRLHVADGHIASSFNNLSGFVQLWGDNSIMWRQGNSNGGLRFGSATGLSAENYSQKMVLRDNGRLGIGSMNPIGKLQIDLTNTDYENVDGEGSALMLNNPNVLGQTALTFMTHSNLSAKIRSDYEGNLNSVAYSGSHCFFTGGDFGTGRIRMVINKDGNMFFGNDIENSNDGAGSSLFINSEGKVGIGTTNPGIYQLAVNGDIVAKKVKVTQDQSFWPDYVFEPHYKLVSLDSVETFITEKKHLPGVPSAKQIKDEGIDLGDNQTVLLKKIEELTLYLIEMKKDYNTQLRKQEEALHQQAEEIKLLKSQSKH